MKVAPENVMTAAAEPAGGAAMEVDDVSKETLLSLQGLDPDFNKDGKIEAYERVIYDSLHAADVDKDGSISRREFYEAMLKAAVDVEASRRDKGSIPISALNPDTEYGALFSPAHPR